MIFATILVGVKEPFIGLSNIILHCKGIAVLMRGVGSRGGAEARRYGVRYLGIAASVTVTDVTVADTGVIEPTATGTAAEAKHHQKLKANAENGKRTYKSTVGSERGHYLGTIEAASYFLFVGLNNYRDLEFLIWENR